MILPKFFVQQVVRFQEQGPSRFNKIRMDRNERTYPYSEEFIKRVKNRLNGEVLMSYPEPEPLYEKISQFLGQPQQRILFHSGSDLCIKAIFEAYINPGDKVLLHKPGYAMFSVYAKLFGAEAVYQDFDSDLHFDYARYISRIDSSFRMAALENPNGFIGVAPPKEFLWQFVRQCEREGVIALVDEAYFFFHKISAVELLNECENLIIVRTFSKAFGLAGLRAGYLLSREENIRNLCKVKPMHELNGFAIMLIDELLDCQNEFDSYVEATMGDLNYFKEGFLKLGIETSESVCNFLAARVGRYVDSDRLSTNLQEEGILLRRPFSEPHLKEWMRIGTAPIRYEQRVLDEIAVLIELKMRRANADL